MLLALEVPAARADVAILRRGIIAAILLLLMLVPAMAGEKKATIPLHSLAELAAWTPKDAPWNAANEALRARPSAAHPLASLWVPRASGQSVKGRVIVMHDMGEGYLPDQDRYPAGTANAKLYRFSYWQYIDTFIYFSHSRVSYPPPGWTDSAHRNGVRILGTFVIEGDGSESRKEVRELLDDPRRRRGYARQLARLAAAYRFDGYLVNIETTMPGDTERKRQRSKSLRRFVNELKREMRKVTPVSTVLWYDSVTRAGRVAYQNELNGKNKPFFDAADGMTVNYDWSPPEEAGSPKQSAKMAGSRAREVYSSVDVFCRESDRRYCAFRSYLGARAAFGAGTSFGVFGPAWTYEGEGSKPDRSTFARRDRRFWIGKGPESAPAGGIAAFVAARPVPSDLPFVTHFNQGFGDALYRDGVLKKRGTWGNVGEVDVLPTWQDLALVGADGYAAALSTAFAFSGGSSFRVAATARPEGYTLRPLFLTAFTDARTVTVTAREDGLQAAIVLVAADTARLGAPRVLTLLPPGKDRAPVDIAFGLPRKTTVTRAVPRATRQLNGWSRRTYDVAAWLGPRTIAAIGIVAFPTSGASEGASVALGALEVR